MSSGKDYTDYTLCTSNPKCMTTIQNRVEEKEDELLCMKLRDTAQVPCKSYQGDAGFDLAAAFPDDTISITIPPGERRSIPTGIAAECPPHLVYQVWPRSGLANKFGIEVLAGVVDSNYRGEIMAILQNNGQVSFTVKKGDKIAQLLPVRLANFSSQYLTLVDKLSPSERDTKGFGSSDRRQNEIKTTSVTPTNPCSVRYLPDGSLNRATCHCFDD